MSLKQFQKCGFSILRLFCKVTTKYLISLAYYYDILYFVARDIVSTLHFVELNFINLVLMGLLSILPLPCVFDERVLSTTSYTVFYLSEMMLSKYGCVAI